MSKNEEVKREKKQRWSRKGEKSIQNNPALAISGLQGKSIAAFAAKTKGGNVYKLVHRAHQIWPRSEVSFLAGVPSEKKLRFKTCH